jgi:hypothetical protein
MGGTTIGRLNGRARTVGDVMGPSWTGEGMAPGTRGINPGPAMPSMVNPVSSGPQAPATNYVQGAPMWEGGPVYTGQPQTSYYEGGPSSVRNPDGSIVPWHPNMGTTPGLDAQGNMDTAASYEMRKRRGLIGG